MNKSELISSVAKKLEIKKAEAEKFLAAFLDEISANISQEEGVRLAGFGNFCLVQRSAREGRNPSNGEKISIPARKAAVFKPGKILVDAAKEATESL